MTDEEKLAALEDEKFVLEQRIAVKSLIKVLETAKYISQLTVSGLDLGNNHINTLVKNPSPEIRLALAKVFRVFYGIKETQDDK